MQEILITGNPVLDSLRGAGLILSFLEHPRFADRGFAFFSGVLSEFRRV